MLDFSASVDCPDLNDAGTERKGTPIASQDVARIHESVTRWQLY
jgi:hypothetical protein